jgi:hypothetical protein
MIAVGWKGRVRMRGTRSAALTVGVFAVVMVTGCAARSTAPAAPGDSSPAASPLPRPPVTGSAVASAPLSKSAAPVSGAGGSPGASARCVSGDCGVAPSGVALVLDDAQRFRIEDLATGATLHAVALGGIPGGPSLIATNPTGGWVVTYTPDVSPSWGFASTRLALVSTDGRTTPCDAPLGADLAVTGLAVSPDGGRLAFALFPYLADQQVASIVVMPMPGHDGTTHTWPVADATVNEIEDLSWAPDGRHLSYIAGFQTGAGIGSNPITLDTATSGKAPTRSSWPSTGVPCGVDSATWLGASGRFAVIADCAPAGAYIEVQPSSGKATGTKVPLAGYGCGGADMHPSPDGSKLLISWCDSAFFVAGGSAIHLAQHVVDAAW